MTDHVARPQAKRQRLLDALQEARSFRLCSPSDDPEYQTFTSVAFRSILARVQRLASPLMTPADADLLNSLHVEYGDLCSVYDAWSVLDAMLPDIESAAQSANDADLALVARGSIIGPELVHAFETANSEKIDCAYVAKVCQEINWCYSVGHNIAALLLMRTLLNAVPPVFGHTTFAQVVASSGQSLKASFEHLEEGLRKVADFHAHALLRPVRPYPTAAQVEPFKPQYELLLHEVLARVGNG